MGTSFSKMKPMIQGDMNKRPMFAELRASEGRHSFASFGPDGVMVSCTLTNDLHIPEVPEYPDLCSYSD
jgi:hypothetical protein